MTRDEKRIELVHERAKAREMSLIEACRTTHRDTDRVQSDGMMVSRAKQELARVRICQEVFGVSLEPRSARGAGRHLGEMRQTQADTRWQSVDCILARHGSRPRHVHAFGFKLPATIRSQ
jgi:hypothetical protein